MDQFSVFFQSHLSSHIQSRNKLHHTTAKTDFMLTTMESYDKENSCNSKTLPATGTQGNKRAFGVSKNGVISERKQWAEEQMRKGPMTAAPKGQDIAGTGIIARQRKWHEEQMQKGPMTAAPKGQNIAGTGIIARQRKWHEEQMNKGPITSAPKGQDIAGTGIIARQKKWAEEQSQKQMTTQVAEMKDQGVGGSGIFERQKRAPPASIQAPAPKRTKAAVLPKPAEETEPVNVPNPTVGCYLTYETDSGGRLMLCYQKGGNPPSNVVGFSAAGEGKTIQGFKFSRNCGRSELIKGIAGGDSNRRRYFDGWCQFVKLAKAMVGSVKKFHVPGHGVDVDVYGFKASESRPSLLDLDSGFVDVSKFDAVAVVPRHKTFLQGVKKMPLSTFLEKGGIAGSSTLLK